MSQVNLLPPELRARQKVKQLTTLIIGAGAAIIVLLLAFWFLQGQKLARGQRRHRRAEPHELGSADADRSAAGVPAAAGGGGRPRGTAHHGMDGRGVLLADADGPVADDPVRRLPRLVQRRPHRRRWWATVPTTTTTTFVGSFTSQRRRGRVREPRELADAPRIRQGMGQPLDVERDRDRPEHRAVHVQQRRRPVEDALTARGKAGEPSGG